MAPITQRHALITGSSAGIGLAIAKVLASQGVGITINGRHASTLSVVAEALRREFPDVHVAQVAADLSMAEGVAQLLRDMQALPAVDILINNLGIFSVQSFEDADDATWQRFLDTNVMSGVRLCRALMPGMRQRDWGRVVFISSESGICPPADMVHYGVTKSAQLSLARGLAETCIHTGVTVNAVLPGPTLTEGAQVFFEAAAQREGIPVEEAHRQFFAQGRPTSIIRRFIRPEEVAALVAHVCSDAGGAIQGAALRVDGGVVRSIV